MKIHRWADIRRKLTKAEEARVQTIKEVMADASDQFSDMEEMLAALYQVAGERLMAEDALTAGQRARLTELILNVLSDPTRYNAELVRDLHELAKQP